VVATQTAARPALATKAAKAAGLYYVNEGEPGLTRVGAGTSLRLRRPNGTSVRDQRVRRRVQRLVIPPAWTDVWICSSPRGHIQAMGRDARGRRQYIYHRAWREVRDGAKFDRIVAFARALPRIRARVARDLAKRTLSKECILATIVRLLDVTHIRVGNEEYARNNGSFGLTTLRARHATTNGNSLQLEFRAKSGKLHRSHLGDRRLARIVRACQDLPGQNLFQYLDGGVPRPVTSNDVNAYLREISGADFTAKDFRTWAGTVLMATAPCESEHDADCAVARGVPAAVKVVARKLGNTPAVCRKSYIHPAIIEGHAIGALVPRLKTLLARRRSDRAALSGGEAAVLAFLSRTRKN
jgi:DNA topoisomerase-1